MTLLPAAPAPDDSSNGDPSDSATQKPSSDGAGQRPAPIPRPPRSRRLRHLRPPGRRRDQRPPNPFQSRPLRRLKSLTIPSAVLGRLGRDEHPGDASVCNRRCIWQLLVGTSWASADTVQADALFDQGKQLMEEGNTDAACEKFQASFDMLERLGVLLNLANCQKEAGRTASAHANFKRAEAMANKAGESDRAEYARAAAEGLEGSLSTLAVNVADPVPGLVVKRNGEVLSEASFGLPVPSDPGEMTITAEAEGYVAWSTTITIGQEKSTESIAVPLLEKDPTAGEGDSGAPPLATAGSDDDGVDLTTVGFIVGGVGVVGVALGAVTGLVAAGTASSAEDDPALCPNKECTPAGREEIDSAESTATVSTIGFIVGGLAVAAGVTLVIIGSSGGDGGPDAVSLTLVPHAGPTDGGLGLHGRF